MALALLALLLGWTPAVAEPEAYSIGFGGHDLVRVDLASGQEHFIGTLAQSVGPMTLGPEGRLYASDGLQLLQIDTRTAEITPIGPHRIADPIDFLEMTADACGRLWMTDINPPAGNEPANSTLYELDPATGRAFRSIELAGLVWGLAARGGTLFGARPLSYSQHELVSLDPEEGSLTAIRTLTPGPPIFSLDFASPGILWGLGLGPPITPQPTAVLRIDVDTGELTDVLDHHMSDVALAIAPPSGACGAGVPLAIPAAGPWGLAALALALAAAGGLLLARRSSSAGSPAQM